MFILLFIFIIVIFFGESESVVFFYIVCLYLCCRHNSALFTTGFLCHLKLDSDIHRHMSRVLSVFNNLVR